METWKELNISSEIKLASRIEIFHNVEELQIIFKVNKKCIKVSYAEPWFSYRATPANLFFKKGECQTKEKTKNRQFPIGLYHVENSEYLRWLHRVSNGVHEHFNRKLEHYVFIGSNLVFEILTIDDPEFVVSID